MTPNKKKKTGLEVFLILELCVFVVCGTLYSNGLSKDGRLYALWLLVHQDGTQQGEKDSTNVCQEWKWRTVATSTLVSTVSYQTYISRSKLCGWRRCRKSRTVTSYKLKTIYRRTIDTYFRCCNGWRRRGNECPIAICRYGCKNGGSCYSPNRCRCTPFWTGPNCGIDVNECSSNNGDFQQQCINRRGTSRLCSCNSWYKTSPYDSKKCVDVDECQRLIECTCASGSNSCGKSCRNTVGSYYCTWGKSYRL
ncbi:epidermal growth factor-like protein 7 isoform X1 [Stylophora pistillata]|uniref:epidermal growth factor-like protein 7 isoform X1 n=1 Tax=Stylophora pistillata TaxID=50429 RepID=UPI000C038D42|nr:epidermal growth factor-like protein 7 isoform X1 [Stylophora pistillata]